MSGIQSKIIRHEKKQKNMTHCEDNTQLIHANPELTQTLEGTDKDIKSVITILHVFEKFSRDTEATKHTNKTQTELRVLKTMMSPTESSPDGVTNRLDTIEKKISEPESTVMETTRMRHKVLFLRRKGVVCETAPDACVIGAPKRERKDRKAV